MQKMICCILPLLILLMLFLFSAGFNAARGVVLRDVFMIGGYPLGSYDPNKYISEITRTP